MTFQRMLILLLLILAGGRAAGAQGLGPSWTVVLNPQDGTLLENVRFDPEWEGHPPSHAYVHTQKWEVLPEERKPESSQMKLPSAYAGSEVRAEAWRGTPAGNVLVFLRKQSAAEDDPSGEGHFVVVKPSTGEIVSDLDFPCSMSAAGRSLTLRPGLAVWGRFAAWTRPDGTTRIQDLDTGRLLWSLPIALRPCEAFDGIWVAGRGLYLETERGLMKVDPATGNILWTYPNAGHIRRVRLQPDGYLYASFDGDPDTLLQSLKAAAARRYPGKDCHPQVVPYRKSYFGSTRIGGYESGNIAIWERVGEGWSWIFEYSESLPEARRDRLFEEHQFSPRMRKRLEFRSP